MTSRGGSRPMTVGELSRRSGVSVKNLRQYSDDGLDLRGGPQPVRLPPVR
jgi:hypothetical protein